jgi:hypothetical protein
MEASLSLRLLVPKCHREALLSYRVQSAIEESRMSRLVTSYYKKVYIALLSLIPCRLKKDTKECGSKLK